MGQGIQGTKNHNAIQALQEALNHAGANGPIEIAIDSRKGYELWNVANALKNSAQATDETKKMDMNQLLSKLYCAVQEPNNQDCTQWSDSYGRGTLDVTAYVNQSASAAATAAPAAPAPAPTAAATPTPAAPAPAPTAAATPTPAATAPDPAANDDESYQRVLNNQTARDILAKEMENTDPNKENNELDYQNIWDNNKAALEKAGVAYDDWARFAKIAGPKNISPQLATCDAEMALNEKPDAKAISGFCSADLKEAYNNEAQETYSRIARSDAFGIIQQARTQTSADKTMDWDQFYKDHQQKLNAAEITSPDQLRRFDEIARTKHNDDATYATAEDLAAVEQEIPQLRKEAFERMVRSRYLKKEATAPPLSNWIKETSFNRNKFIGNYTYNNNQNIANANGLYRQDFADFYDIASGYSGSSNADLTPEDVRAITMDLEGDNTLNHNQWRSKVAGNPTDLTPEEQEFVRVFSNPDNLQTFNQEIGQNGAFTGWSAYGKRLYELEYPENTLDIASNYDAHDAPWWQIWNSNEQGFTTADLEAMQKDLENGGLQLPTRRKKSTQPTNFSTPSPDGYMGE